MATCKGAGRFAPQSHFLMFRIRFPSADCGKILKKGDGLTDGHDSGGVPQIRDPSESDQSGKMGSTAQDLLVLEFLVLGQ